MNRRKVKIALRSAAVVLAVGVLQMGFFNELTVDGRVCEPLLTFSVACGLKVGARRGLIIGLFAGLLYDVLSGLPLGLATFAYTFIAIVAGWVGEYVSRIWWGLTPPLVTLGVFFYVLIGEIFGEEQFFNSRLPATLAVAAVGGAILAPGMYWLSGWMWDQPSLGKSGSQSPHSSRA